jgi:hypothetical protein
MTKFFVPGAASPQMAEEGYAGFVKNSATYPLAHPTARLFRVSFPKRNRANRETACVAEVGKEMENWPEPHGPVLGIVETSNEIVIHTKRGVLHGDLIHVGPSTVTERVYFEDYAR